MGIRPWTAQNGASGYKNNGNNYVIVYNPASGLTIKDGQGNTQKGSTTPLLLPPGFSITSGVTTDFYYGLEFDSPEELRGFLSRRGTTAGTVAGTITSGWGTSSTASAGEVESETITAPTVVGMGAHTESEAWTHT